MKRPLLVVVNGILASVCFINLLDSNGSQFSAIGGVLLFGGGALFFLFKDKFDAWSSARTEKRIKNIYCRFDETCISFPEGYYFGHGYLKNKKELAYELINEIRINTFPATAVINNNEIIFLSGADKEACKNLALSKKIPVTEPPDNWSLICEEFLDTEHEESYKEAVIHSLETNGFGKSEIIEIRSRISKRMMTLTALSWEWIYYGQYDVLKQLWPLTETKYWWTMEIALRTKKVNYREATVGDIDQMHVVRITVKENALSDPNLITPKEYEEFLTQRGKGWVCEINDQVVGFSIVDLKENNIWALFVHPDHEKKGIGKKLHGLMLDWYFAQGKESVWLGTAPNTRAAQFYRQEGWTETGTHGKGEIKFEMTSVAYNAGNRK